jgi:hypothetical protein
MPPEFVKSIWIRRVHEISVIAVSSSNFANRLITSYSGEFVNYPYDVVCSALALEFSEEKLGDDVLIIVGSESVQLRYA